MIKIKKTVTYTTVDDRMFSLYEDAFVHTLQILLQEAILAATEDLMNYLTSDMVEAENEDVAECLAEHISQPLATIIHNNLASMLQILMRLQDEVEEDG